MVGRCLTASGGCFDLRDPRPEDVCLWDVARALANQCRYGGQVRAYYSVAEHCVRLVRHLRSQGYAENAQQVALLHDAEEAYARDFAAPQLEVLPDGVRLSLEDLGLRVREAVFLACRLPVEAARYRVAFPGLHELDIRIRADEIAALYPPSCAWAYEGLEPLGVFADAAPGWSPMVAHCQYMLEAERLGLAA